MTEAAGIGAVTALTVIIVQQAKRLGVTGHHAGWVTAAVSALVVLVWIWSASAFARDLAFEHLTTWAASWAAAVGVYEMARDKRPT